MHIYIRLVACLTLRFTHCVHFTSLLILYFTSLCGRMTNDISNNKCVRGAGLAPGCATVRKSIELCVCVWVCVCVCVWITAFVWYLRGPSWQQGNYFSRYIAPLTCSHEVTVNYAISHRPYIALCQRSVIFPWAVSQSVRHSLFRSACNGWLLLIYRPWKNGNPEFGCVSASWLKRQLAQRACKLNNNDNSEMKTIS